MAQSLTAVRAAAALPGLMPGACSPMAVGMSSSLLGGPRGMLQAISLVSAPALVASAVLIALAAGPYSRTVQMLRSQAPGGPV